MTRFDFRLHPLAGPIWQATLAYAADGADEALGALADVAAEAPRAHPRRLDRRCARLAVRSRAVARAAGRDALGRLRRRRGGRRAAGRALRAAGPFAEDAGEATYLDLQRSADESAAPGFRRCWKAHFLPALDHALAATFLEHGVQAAEESPGAGCFFALGALPRRGPGDTAFAHRAAQWDFMASARWSTPPTMRASSESRARRPRRWRRSRGVYLADDLGDEGSDRVRAAYGDETYARAGGREGAPRPEQRLPPEPEHPPGELVVP